MEHYSKLDPREQRFVDLYMEERSPALAVRRLGYTGKNASKAGWEMMNRPGVRQAIREFELAQGARHHVTPENAIETLGSLLRFDPRQIFRKIMRPVLGKDDKPVLDECGRPRMREEEEVLPVTEWPDDAARAVIGWDNHGRPKFVHRTDTLRMVLQHFGMLQDARHDGSTPAGLEDGVEPQLQIRGMSQQDAALEYQRVMMGTAKPPRDVPQLAGPETKQ